MTITWQIEWMKTTVNTETPPLRVIECGWRCTGIDEQYSGSVYGSCSFSEISDNFIPYEELTEEQVLNWCWNSSVSKESVETSIVAQIEQQKNPPVIQPKLPWMS